MHINNDYLIIAEVGQAHDGSLGILHSYIDALAETGVNAIKFQTHIASAESSHFEEFRIPFSYEDKSRFDYWKRMEFSHQQWCEIKKHCEEKGVTFMSSPFSIEALELLESIGTEVYKVGSGEMTNYLLLDRLAQLNKPVILSSGLSSLNEVREACARFDQSQSSISILQCTTQYPTPTDQVGINVITEFKREFPNYAIGLSDHSGEIYPSIAAATLGARVFEFHAVFDKRMFGPDSTSSLTIDQIKELVRALGLVKNMLEHPVDKSLNTPLARSKTLFGKSLALRQDLPKGSILRIEHLETKKPSGLGVDASEYQSVLGKRLKKSLTRNSFLKIDDIE